MNQSVICSDEIQICMDVGSAEHYVAIGLASGKRLEELVVKHTSSSIRQFFEKIEALHQQYRLPVAVAMEGYNGHVRPIDKQVLAKGYRLYSINHLHLARYREMFPAPAKSDSLDAWKIYEFLGERNNPKLKKNAIQEVRQSPEISAQLKALSRRRSRFVREQTRLSNQLHGDLASICPGIMAITGSITNLWYLRFISCREDIRKLKSLRLSSLLQVRGIGKNYAKTVQQWQETAEFCPDAEWIGPGIVNDAKRLLELHGLIGDLEKAMARLMAESEVATLIATVPGFGTICASEMAGEVGEISRFATEAAFGYYCGMAPLTKSSGKKQGARRSKNVNRIIQRALMIGSMRHIQKCAPAQKYYDRKRREGKAHNQAVRALGRHLCRMIWSMLRNRMPYNPDKYARALDARRPEA